MAFEKVETISKPIIERKKYWYVISYETLDDHKATAQVTADNVYDALEKVNELSKEMFNLEYRIITNIFREEWEEQ